MAFYLQLIELFRGLIPATVPARRQIAPNLPVQWEPDRRALARWIRD